MSDVKENNVLNDAALNEVSGGTVIPVRQKAGEFYTKPSDVFSPANVWTPSAAAPQAPQAPQAVNDCLDTDTGTETPRGKIKL